MADWSRYITTDPDILGGWPIIRGTRMLTSAIARRVNAGDTIEQLVAEFPHVPREAFEAAVAYEAEHRPRPRPRPPRPWHRRSK